MTAKSIPTEMWTHAESVLVFYFSRRHGSANARDLAHDTIVALLKSDYEFREEQDFTRVCYGFAAMISIAEYRKQGRKGVSLAGFDMEAPDPRNTSGLNSVEVGILIDQVKKIAEAGMRAEDWQLIWKGLHASNREELAEGFGLGSAGNARVKVFRAFAKLRKLIRPEKDQTVTGHD